MLWIGIVYGVMAIVTMFLAEAWHDSKARRLYGSLYDPAYDGPDAFVFGLFAALTWPVSLPALICSWVRQRNVATNE